MTNETSKSIQSVKEMVDLPPDIGNASVFARLGDIVGELCQKLKVRFDLRPDPFTQDLQAYTSPNGDVKGALKAFSGSEIDWLVHFWLCKPASSFGVVLLEAWLGSQIWVPHLIVELISFPDILFYIDYIPRTDLLTDLEYLERYYEPVKQTDLALRDDSRLSRHVTPSLYMRQLESPTCLCYQCAATADCIELIRSVACEMLDRWLAWLDETEPVPENKRAALAERDLFVRRTSAERAPANEMALLLLGVETHNKLVRALWGGDRTST